MKIVGHRRAAMSPEEALRRASRLISEATRLAPRPRPRGFVFKAKTWEDLERWQAAQSNSRLW